jgi:hypothetical protein
MAEQPLSIGIFSANMQKQNAYIHTHLQTHPVDIFLFQEPWFDRIAMLRSDTDPLRTEILGILAHPLFQIFLPRPQEPAKVMAYVRWTLLA